MVTTLVSISLRVSVNNNYFKFELNLEQSLFKRKKGRM